MIVICVVIGSWIVNFKGDRPDPVPRKDIKIGEYRASEPARREEQSPRRPTGNAIPLEQKLATIDGVEFDNVKVKRFRSLLSQLDGTYVEDQEQIADMTVKAKQLLADEGISETLLNILEGMNQVFTTKIDNQKYVEYVAPYVTLRKKGHSHREAVRGLAAIVNSLTAR